MVYKTTPSPSGNRFEVLYKLSCSPAEVDKLAQEICVEQTVEFPQDLLPAGDIPDQVVGRVQEIQSGADAAHVRISYPVEAAGADLVQLLNTLFGNTSLKSDVRLEKIFLTDGMLANFRGPRFGISGLRRLLNVPTRPLLCTALKPLGLAPADLAEQAYKFALGGIDLIKDDHGITDQPFAHFKERVERCSSAVSRANRQSGFKSIYLPSLGVPYQRLPELANFAKQAGAGGLLVMPALTGFDSMRMLAEDDKLGLPIMMHPALIGGYLGCKASGISHYALFGQIARLAGADATIYPNFGGRFSFSQAECLDIAAGARDPLGQIRTIFPAPAGGMTMERVPDMLKLYGKDIVFLIGGGLHRQNPDLLEASRYFRNLVEGL